MNYIILNGVKSNTINGLMICTLPPITKPPIRTEITEIDGRDGDIITNLGYSAYEKTFEIGLYGEYDINEVISYFDSSGTITFSNESDKYYNYQIIDGIDFEKLIRFKTATVTLHVQPFKYSLVDKVKSYKIKPQLLDFVNWEDNINGINTKVTGGTILVSGTASAATEVYIPIPSVTLGAGNYTLNILASGTNVDSLAVRLIYNSPTVANSFGGTYATPINDTKVSINTNITTTKTYNYIYLSIPSGASVGLSMELKLENDDTQRIIIRNSGNTTAKPTITIYGAGTMDVSLNGTQIFIVALGGEEYITIDVAKMEAYKGTELKNRLVTGNYENFVLKVGKNVLNIAGEASGCKIENFSRWV